jgi:tetratricopeptide (TPR) repeat protein
MECPGFQREELIDRYLTGSLTPEEQESFEEHYFACDPCFAALQAQRALQAELSASAPQIRNMPVSSPARFRWKIALAAAAVLILGVLGIRWGLTLNSSPATPPTQTAKSAPAGPSLSELARFDPPNYRQAVLRGNQDKAMREFRLAMKRYQQSDYAGAIGPLGAAVKLNPKDPGPLFFLGVSHLLANQTDDGSAVLQQCIALGDTPYLEEAHYYLAKAFLRKGDAAAARRELEEVVRLRGDHEDEAQRLHQQLAAFAKDLH